jgi:hypothetical protein
MKTTEQLTLTQRLLEFQKQINVIKKDAKNPHFKNTYATLQQVLSEVKPILNEVGLLLTQPIDERGIGTLITDGKDSIASFIPMPNGLPPQQLGSAISYFRRYTICSLLSLEIDDDDANTTNKAIQETNSYKPLNIIGIKQTLKGAKSLNELQNIWNTLSNEAKLNVEINQLKDDLKTQLP